MRFLQAVLKTLFYVVIGAVLSLIGAAVFFMNWEPDRSLHPVRGIDVSHHQGAIDWAQVAADDVAFVYLKATEGGDFKDQRFEANWHAAGEVGLARGAYHYYSLCKSPDEQAANFLSVLPAGDAMLPPVLDFEFVGNCDRRPPVDEVVADVAAFVAKVEAASGKRMMIYAPETSYHAYLENQGLTRPLWVRSLWRSADYGKGWKMWQYHMRGSVAGIDGAVDLNVLAPDVTLDLLVR